MWFLRKEEERGGVCVRTAALVLCFVLTHQKTQHVQTHWKPLRIPLRRVRKLKQPGEQMNCLNISVTTWSSYFSLLIQFYILATKDTNYSVCVNLKLSSFKKFETLTIVKINYWRSFSVYNLITELNSGSCAKRKHNIHETLTRRC